jgi:hypothetical protein
MSKYYNLVKKNYDNRFWSLDKVRDAVVKGWITADEYEEITGEVYA